MEIIQIVSIGFIATILAVILKRNLARIFNAYCTGARIIIFLMMVSKLQMRRGVSQSIL